MVSYPDQWITKFNHFNIISQPSYAFELSKRENIYSWQLNNIKILKEKTQDAARETIDLSKMQTHETKYTLQSMLFYIHTMGTEKGKQHKKTSLF